MADNTKKTLRNFKDEVAKKHGHAGIRYCGWVDMECRTGYNISLAEEAAELYAQYMSSEAWEEGNLSGHKSQRAPYPECKKFNINPYKQKDNEK